jgi:NADH-quinone oxidoreductase subunit M
MGIGFYTTPWLKYIDQEASEIGEHYPEHHTHHINEPAARDTQVKP